MQVSINVYDVTNTANDNTNGMITRLNSITRELNLGGVFHGAVQLEEVEWSFGYCESGTGVYCCRARSNSLYTFREHVELGVTQKTKQEIKEILTRFKRTWPGTSYDLLQRNCCHFCEELCTELGVPNPPAWLNRFAQGADATVKFTNEASALAKRVGSNISSTAQQSASWLRELSQRVLSQISVPPLEDGAAASPPGDEGAAASPLYARPVSPHSCSASVCGDSDSRREAGSMGRLTSRLRQFGVGTAGAGSTTSAPAISLPASTPSSSCDLAARAGAASPSQQQPLTMALRQKWQELEASAGDGTKQFLFGLIKTRQARLEEGEPSLGDKCERRNPTGAPDSPGRAAGHVSGGPMGHPGAPGAAARDAGAEPTQAPTLQIISNALLPPDVVGGSPATTAAVAAAAAAPSPSALRQTGPDTERAGGAAGPASWTAQGVVAQGPTAGAAAVTSSSGAGSVGRSAPPEQHLLDM